MADDTAVSPLKQSRSSEKKKPHALLEALTLDRGPRPCRRFNLSFFVSFVVISFVLFVHFYMSQFQGQVACRNFT